MWTFATAVSIYTLETTLQYWPPFPHSFPILPFTSTEALFLHKETLTHKKLQSSESKCLIVTWKIHGGFWVRVTLQLQFTCWPRLQRTWKPQVHRSKYTNLALHWKGAENFKQNILEKHTLAIKCSPFLEVTKDTAITSAKMWYAND